MFIREEESQNPAAKKSKTIKFINENILYFKKSRSYKEVAIGMAFYNINRLVHIGKKIYIVG